MNILRLFIAIPLPPDVRHFLSDIASGLPFPVRVTPEPHFHLTLFFLGDSPEGNVPRICQKLRQVPDCGSIPLTLGRVGFFTAHIRRKNGRRPKMATVFYTALVPSTPLVHVYKHISEAMQTLQFEAPARRFHPHITIARSRGTPIDIAKNSIRRINEELAGKTKPMPITFSIASFCLYQSVLSGDGAHYTELERFSL